MIIFQNPKFKASILTLALLALLPACSPLGFTAGLGATAGAAASREGGINQAITDTQIRAQINDLWFRENIDMYNKLSLTIREGRVMITGQVPDPQMRVDAIRLAWQADGVEQVINEIRVEKGAGIAGYATDTLIITKLRARLTFDKEIKALNYTLDAVGGVVYLLGVAQNQAELDKVIDHARDISYVKEVVSYVRIKETEKESESDPNADSSTPAQPPNFQPYAERKTLPREPVEQDLQKR